MTRHKNAVIPTSHKATGNKGEYIMEGILFDVHTGGGHGVEIHHKHTLELKV